ncbi:MAG: hypothetical protein IKM26_07770 [Clostridia bacterium]|nr:hypothetical protein [Clostridia bacterium]
MTKTIAQIWKGTLDPARYSGADQPAVRELADCLEQDAEELAKELTEEAKEQFRCYCDRMNDYIALINEQAFCDGFCLGAKIVTEALTAPVQPE